VGFEIDPVGDRDHRQIAAGHGDELTKEEQTEFSIAAQRTEVNKKPGHCFIVRG
jgi:hypothetical protein